MARSQKSKKNSHNHIPYEQIDTSSVEFLKPVTHKTDTAYGHRIFVVATACIFMISLLVVVHGQIRAQANPGTSVGVSASVPETPYNTRFIPPWEKYWNSLDLYTRITYLSSAGLGTAVLAGVALLKIGHRKKLSRV